jgi:hypothetical protein
MKAHLRLFGCACRMGDVTENMRFERGAEVGSGGVGEVYFVLYLSYLKPRLNQCKVLD